MCVCLRDCARARAGDVGHQERGKKNRDVATM